MPKKNLFAKMVVLIVLMVLPIVGLYFYSNKISTDVLDTELGRSNLNQLVFFQSQVNANFETLSLWPNLLLQDPDISSFQQLYLESDYFDLDEISLVKRIQSKLSLQQSASNWQNKLSIYSPSLRRYVTANDTGTYDPALLGEKLRAGWQVRQMQSDSQTSYLFSWTTALPYSAVQSPEEASLIVEIEFDSRNIVSMLDKFKSDGRRDPIYYNREVGAIFNRTANEPLARQLIALLEKEPFEATDSRMVRLDGETYLVSMAKSDITGWYLIDYMPQSDILAPIERSNRQFYYSTAALLLMSSLAAYLLYIQVQVPLRQLVVAFHKLKNGDYSVRLSRRGNSEFSFLFIRFNSMVEQIQDLFERVYLEKIHVREARLKQLQSQINPHFFYNCFSFISSMAKLKNEQAVVGMAHHLSHYYRYTTRQERELVTVAEELDFVTHYLSIQRMRMSRLDFHVDVPPRLRKLEIPPLVVQPLVENAVLHGIEPQPGAGRIAVRGEISGGEARLVVEDDGKGMSETELLILTRKLEQPMDSEMGCGLWNVHQRLHLRFGANAGLRFEPMPSGGLRVTLAWPLSADHSAQPSAQPDNHTGGSSS
ncbi:sensor histidine kinase [Paenibacillus thermoaerophilus]|uniref:Sensor histidine kinase n=1 Tax=Paenibacillus thermoaerophilus TaxID=1215385 RepID=A0ABW2V4G7_9BACL|nr:sensor histidine kinase [Paenibacillus thermoaerophilus]TMV17465.1 sensor histidine kinase [Paenibacillus thermoaerophilus]